MSYSEFPQLLLLVLVSNRPSDLTEDVEVTEGPSSVITVNIYPQVDYSKPNL